MLQISFILIFAAVFFASYLFILQPAWDPPPEDINQNGYIEIENEGGYLLKHKDGTWSYVFPNGLVAELSEETAKVFIADGDPIMEE